MFFVEPATEETIMANTLGQSRKMERFEPSSPMSLILAFVSCHFQPRSRFYVTSSLVPEH